MARHSRHLGGYILRNGVFTPSLIKSIQSGTIAQDGSGAATATITAVNTNNAVLVYCGASNSVNQNNINFGRLVLTNSTTVTLISAGSVTMTASFMVIEFYPGVLKSVQYGTIQNSGTATINATNQNKTWLSFLGWSNNDGGAGDLREFSRFSQTNATTITGTWVGAGLGEATTVGFCAAEFY